MTRVIDAELMIECPREARCHVPWPECKVCTYNKYWSIHKYAVECGYDSLNGSKTK